MRQWELGENQGQSVGQPHVLFSTPEARGVVLHLRAGEEMGRHQVRERAIVQVISGRALIDCEGQETEASAGSLVVFEPAEPHAVRAATAVELLVILAPWPAPEHYADGEAQHDPNRLPRHATQEPKIG